MVKLNPNMNDPRFQYEKINAIKIILVNKEGKVLLVKEPETNEWMPGHWGLPGGKSLVKESLYQTFKRKVLSDLGIDLEPLGIFRIEELLIEDKTVIMFHAVSKLEDVFEPKGEISEYKWVGIEDLEAMEVAEFTEFFNKNLLLEYLTGNREIIDFDLIETQQYYDLDQDPEFQKWLQSGKKDDKSQS